MRITAVLAVATAYSGLVNVLAQDGHPMLRELGETESQSQLVPALMFLANTITNNVCWVKSDSVKCNVGTKLGDCGLGIPVPSDNYVDNGRVNKFDQSINSANAKAFVTIKATDSSNNVLGPLRATWISYATGPTGVQNGITFSKPGLYDVSISASDYNAETYCSGCVAVVDNTRPTFTSCPVYTDVKKLSALEKLRAFETSYDSALSIITSNGWSGTDCSSQTYTVKDLGVAQSTSGTGNTPSKCFDKSAQDRNLAKLKTSFFSTDLQTANPDLTSKCTWQCTKSKLLKENVDAFKCLSGTTSTCEGTATCGMDVSVSVTQPEIATISHSIPTAVKEASKRVTDNLDATGAAFNYDTRVYRSVQCSAFDGTDKCTFKSKLSDLVTVSASKPTGSALPNDYKAEDLVFYRYNLNGGTWVEWKPSSDAALSFPNPSIVSTLTTLNGAYSQKVNIQAWTACGMIEQFSVDITVYLHNSLDCSKFPSLITGVQEKRSGGAYCSLPGSDFAIFNMNYKVGDIMPVQESSKVTGTFEKIECTVAAKEETSPAAADTTPATLFTRAKTDAVTSINEDFAVRLVRNPTTSQKTSFTLTCTVTRTLNSNLLADGVYGSEDSSDVYSVIPNPPPTSPQASTTTLTTATCRNTITVTDCESPVLDGPSEPVCTGNCNNDPGFHEVCNGPLVISTSAVTTVSKITSKRCCSNCSPTMQCKAIGTSASAISRCGTTALPMAELVAEEEENFSGETTTALLGASAMIAVVALVVVKRRAHAAARAKENEDAYYPLLE
ncbi:hypothetical protein P3T76_002093 [Phytophthora citrophthora]|uniref:Uncharacterized protein n=1 Tax=Phytophthora citrophthora TaxID=4793 RepID=A0AAD9GWY6_9STRA|nr:hypothetical protein P3T76_002093 [Phytophthora citrophthora]